jgi:hypothetical protein
MPDAVRKPFKTIAECFFRAGRNCPPARKIYFGGQRQDAATGPVENCYKVNESAG